ncbi:hypothetical protein BRE01_62320 [Brevibacillus reuszeri]|uniref:Uncharacterized protein n=1 Tax=Brevibacillus reuszeri TaxID=54915 RepID=A0A0K9YW26_9BACL|nr:hypothetical protein [Brevibacillus reuszeri]KNB72929.1 hypothetical protein ADS79_13970 [Brevibacillus reuszeri]GED72530.1 hypothetical protein BRE01_62320 [Brevibacillus reuszeri]
MIKLQQFYVFKISTSRLNETNCVIDYLTVQQARLNGEIVQIGDNQVFRSIRNIRGISPNSDMIKRLFQERNHLKSLPSSNENSIKIVEIQNEIDKLLFMPDIINVKVDDKKVYKQIFKNGFYVNGIKFLRLSSGSGQSRRSIASFVNVEIKDALERKLNCGVNIKKINVAKYNAYFGLHMSATYPVRTPRVCVIPDCEAYKLRKTVDWVDDEEEIVGGKKTTKRKITKKEIDFVPNMWDGQGLISPEMAKLWQDDLELDYLPSQFGIRSAFIKGMVVVFDFHKFAKNVANTEKIIDYKGDEWDVKDIDVLLSVSQFKMHKFYSSWGEYVDLHKHHGHSWGVTKVNPKVDKTMSLLNYQYIQTLDLDKEKISQLIQFTKDWITKICNGDKLSTLLFLLGSCKDSDTIAEIFDKTNNEYVKAILYNDQLLQDPYIKKTLYESISTKIEEAKIGRLWVNGNYQAMISCPYGQAQWAFSHHKDSYDITGLLKEYQHYSHFWNEKKVTKVDACRSPMVDFHEHNILNFVKNDSTQEWYQYINSGIIYNLWGVDTIRHSDSDWDYDIVFTTDNRIMLDSIYPNQDVITYDKVSAPNQHLNSTNILKTDLRSFDSKVGSITNYSTTFIAMLANFKTDSPEYNELLNRIKLLRRYIGDSIDQAKGIKMKPFPTEWKKRDFLIENDTEEEKKQKYYHNSLVADKKPYFMIYIYDKIRNEYREYKKKSDRACKEKFGCSLHQLLRKQNKSKQEMYYVSDYYRKMPVIKNQCIMNTLCGMIEEVDFSFKRPKNEENTMEMFDILYDQTIALDQYKLNKLIELYKKYKKKRHFKHKNNVLKYIDFETNDENEQDKQIQEFYEEIRNEAYSICSNDKELANHLVYINYYLEPSDPKDFTWDIGIQGIISILQDKNNGVVQLPMADRNGTEYLGQKYSLRDVVV